MSTPNVSKWYKKLDISSGGQPTGIDEVDGLLPTGTCYCIINTHGAIEQVDVYEDGQKIHHKKFTYDDAGRVVENRMYSPDGNGGWHIADDIWHYEYSPVSGLRTKKIMRMPGAPTAHEISYDGAGNRTSERTIKI